jgi:hypothetical protein
MMTVGGGHSEGKLSGQRGGGILGLEKAAGCVSTTVAALSSVDAGRGGQDAERGKKETSPAGP